MAYKKNAFDAFLEEFDRLWPEIEAENSKAAMRVRLAWHNVQVTQAESAARLWIYAFYAWKIQKVEVETYAKQTLCTL